MIENTEQAAHSPVRPSLQDQQAFWNQWNRDERELKAVNPASARRADEVLRIMASLGLNNPTILEVGCANGWLSERLTAFGRVTGTDLADEVIVRARQRRPQIEFIAGDFLNLPWNGRQFDVVIALETVAYVSDQQLFLHRVSDLVKPGGYFILTSVNKFVYQRRDDVEAPGVGQIRHWLSRGELRRISAPYFDVIAMKTVMPAGHGGVLRIVNSPKLNRLVTRIVSQSFLDRLKERFGFGSCIVMLAQRK